MEEKAACDESIWLHHRLLVSTKADLDDIAGDIEKIRANAGELTDIPRPEHKPRM